MHDDNILLQPDDFQYRPAHGDILEDGSVMVSGFNMSQREIDMKGNKYAQLMDLFDRIDQREAQTNQQYQSNAA